MAIIDPSRILLWIRWALPWNVINRYWILGSSSSSRNGDDDNELVLNDDMVGEIFRRLPTKSLMRLNIISKHWNSIIQNPSFAKSYLGGSRGLLFAHLEYNKTPKRLFFSNLNDNNIAQPYYFGCDDPYYVTNMVKGLFGLYSSRFFLCNIATHQRLEFPNISEIAFYFLGFEPLNEVYKILRFVLNGYHLDPDLLHICTGIEICTLGGGLDWRSLDLMPYLTDMCVYEMQSTCINGILYLLGEHCFDKCLSLVALNLSTETFSFIICISPHAPFDYFESNCLVEFGGSPSPALITRVYEYDSTESSQMVIVSTTKKDDNTWTTQIQNVDLMGMTDLAYAGTLPTGEILLAPQRPNDNPLPIYRYNHIQNKLLNWIQVHGLPYFRYDVCNLLRISYHEDSIIPLDCLITIK